LLDPRGSGDASDHATIVDAQSGYLIELRWRWQWREGAVPVNPRADRGARSGLALVIKAEHLDDRCTFNDDLRPLITLRSRQIRENQRQHAHNEARHSAMHFEPSQFEPRYGDLTRSRCQ